MNSKSLKIKLAMFGFMLIFVYMAAEKSIVSNNNTITKKSLQNIYMNYLKTEGYVPAVDEDGDVQFKYEGKWYFITVNEEDPCYFSLSIIFENKWNTSKEERSKVLEAINYSNAKCKISKVFMTEKSIFFTIEIPLKNPEDFSEIFNRGLSVLKNGMTLFAEKI